MTNTTVHTNVNAAATKTRGAPVNPSSGLSQARAVLARYPNPSASRADVIAAIQNEVTIQRDVASVPVTKNVANAYYHKIVRTKAPGSRPGRPRTVKTSV